MSMRMTVLAVLLLVIIMLCGCSGGSGTVGDGMGTLRFSVKFPALPEGQVMPQYLPSALMSLVIEVIDPGTGLPKCDPIIINRSSPGEEVINVSVDAVHIGPTKLIIKGYDGLDGKGTVICDATTQVDVLPNVSVNVNMTMATTVVRIVVSGAPSVLVGGVANLYATGYDVDNSVVLTAAFAWSSGDTSLATVDSTGAVTGVARGVTDIKVEEAKGNAVPALHNMAVNPNIDRVDIAAVGEPYVVPAQTGPTGNPVTINLYQSLDIVAKCYSGDTEITNVPITFTSSDATAVLVSPQSAGSPNATITALQEGGPITITAAQPYTGAEGTLDVTVTALGGIKVSID
jgi:hypothetical protein